MPVPSNTDNVTLSKKKEGRILLVPDRTLGQGQKQQRFRGRKSPGGLEASGKLDEGGESRAEPQRKSKNCLCS